MNMLLQIVKEKLEPKYKCSLELDSNNVHSYLAIVDKTFPVAILSQNDGMLECSIFTTGGDTIIGLVPLNPAHPDFFEQVEATIEKSLVARALIATAK